MGEAESPDRTPDLQGGARREELLTPTLQDYRRPADAQYGRPWQLQSQMWVAFFGGILPATVIAYLNGRRLGISPARRRWMLVVGAAGLLATVALSYAAAAPSAASTGPRSSQWARFGGRAVAMIGFLIFYQLQKSADRVYQFNDDAEYASLWVPGILTTLGVGLLQYGAVYFILRLLL